MAAFDDLTSKMVVLPVSDVDTDQIIPARFLKVTDKAGLGDKLFYDWRYREDGSPEPEFVINRPESKGRKILLAGDNFGCGSSREHAPWALVDWGFRAIISTSFADIFRSNALKNGLLPVVVDEEMHAALLASPELELSIDLDSQLLAIAKESGAQFVEFPIDPFAKKCLLSGIDQLGYLMSFSDEIHAFEERHG